MPTSPFPYYHIFTSLRISDLIRNSLPFALCDIDLSLNAFRQRQKTYLLWQGWTSYDAVVAILHFCAV